MMDTPPNDDVLNAWLDGELAPAQHAEVESWLAANPQDAERIALWAADRDRLRERLDPVLDEPVPQALAQVVWRKAPSVMPATNWQRWAAAIAVFLLGSAVGAGLVWRLQAGEAATAVAVAPQGWVQRAAMAHSVYVPEVRHPVEVKAQEEHLSGWLTKRLNVPVKLFDLREEGFELVGGRLLPDAAGPSAQLMYQQMGPAPVASGGKPAQPVRVTVYLRKPDANTPAAFRFEQQGELGLFYWVEGDSAHGGATGYALVGALPRERLLAMAEAIYKQGQPKP